MKVIKKSETNRFENSDKCAAFEYPLENPDINLAVVEVSGRYPDKGYVANEECTEIAYVLTGKGIVTFRDGESVELEVGDVILLEKGEQYYWGGNCSLCIPCTPAWYPEQHKVFEE